MDKKDKKRTILKYDELKEYLAIRRIGEGKNTRYIVYRKRDL